MYVTAGRHTVLPIMVMLLFQIPLYVGLAIVWKQLNPRQGRHKETPRTLTDSDGRSDATSCAEESQEEHSIDSKQDDEECALRFDAKMEESYQMYSVRLETEL